MRYLPDLRFGTEAYPEIVARRLRATNLLAWILAAVLGVFAAWRLADGSAHWKYAALVALAYVFLPLLHRLNDMAAPLTLVAIGYTWTFAITMVVGIDSGTTYFLLAAAALGIALLGAEHLAFAILVATAAAAAMIALRFVAPRDPGADAVTFYGNFIINVIGSAAMLFAVMYYALRQLTQAEQRANQERERSQRLLLNMLPPAVAERLMLDPDETIADAFPEASVLFADMGGFTARSSDTTPEELVGFLNRVYTSLDSLVERHGLEKIKSAGDAYIVVSGVPTSTADHAAAIANLALDMRETLADLVDARDRHVPVRIGIASGPVVAGVVGTRKFFYDVWGDAVNTAARMESSGEAGKIQIAPETHRLLGARFDLEERGTIEVRGKGPMRTWFLKGRISPRLQSVAA
ncbi:MAG: adenylate/guanylate cyclase domain-containing protein [Rhodospirillales bacterium]|nr:adenylate/guanylate cyclase domain-containing protein [Rhodospirillales bacterium]